MLERRLIEVEGTVQGVGFRPYVHRLAAARNLRGFVRNDAGRVMIDIEGELATVDAFCRDLTLAPPPLSAISLVHVKRAVPMRRRAFQILPSETNAGERAAAAVPPDVATCDACVSELFDVHNRRFGHAFISCTDCGPRFTAIREVPYDRERTNMAPFAPCTVCRAEYETSSDRRFHAEAIACPRCGPVLVARRVNDDNVQAIGAAAITLAAATLRSGGIVALKALGGFHLACSALDAFAIARLRERKHRPAKPLAVMVRDVAAANALCDVSVVEQSALTSSARPVLLLRARDSAAVALVAPHTATLGLMLPSTPLHHLLLAAFNGPLVMTSGNRSDEPVAITDADAHLMLHDVTDVFLAHDRAIVARCDDSIVRVIAGEPRVLRRARGYVPNIIALPFHAASTVLAVGGHLKNTICVAHGRCAHLSAHVGDLGSLAALHAMRVAVESTIHLVGARPRVIAHDLHPDYASTRFAESFATDEGTTHRVPVQHHHAHIAACVAEHGVREPVIGVVFDGAGLGTDGAIWGGEFLVVDGAHFTRCGHLAYVPLPGGDAAARHPWRSAAAHVARADVSATSAARARPASVDEREWQLVQQLVQRHQRTPHTSSVGRLFDAVASLLNLCHDSHFEGEAAMALEAAAGTRVALGYPISLSADHCFTANAARVIAGVLDDMERGRDIADIAAAFHTTLRDLIVLAAERIREASGISIVALSGGVFANARLTATTNAALLTRHFRVLIPQHVPCNDGGLSLGQAYVAACALQEPLCA